MRPPADLVSAFRAQGLKMTPQRQLLFRLLSGNEAHPSADVLFALAEREMPGISLRTVYQTLNDLVAMGELNVLELGTGAARFDPNVSDHHHLVCNHCHEVRDVYVAAPPAPPEGAAGFSVAQTQVVFRGLCARCQLAGYGSPADTPTTKE